MLKLRCSHSNLVFIQLEVKAKCEVLCDEDVDVSSETPACLAHLAEAGSSLGRMF